MRNLKQVALAGALTIGSAVGALAQTPERRMPPMMPPDAGAAGGAGAAAAAGGFGAITLIGWAIGVVIWLWALIDAIRAEFPSNTMKIGWIVGIVFVPCGAIAYLIFGKRSTY